MPLRQAQGRLSRQPAGPFSFVQGRLPALPSFYRSLLSPWTNVANTILGWRDNANKSALARVTPA